jgi:hypothetical protein
MIGNPAGAIAVAHNSEGMIMTCRPYETTNTRLERILSEIEELIRWAQADADHAAENGAPDTAQDDLLRADLLRQAHELIAGCGR